MSVRSSWKVPYFHNIFYSKRLVNKRAIKLPLRNSTIIPAMLDRNIYIYNGKTYQRFLIKKEMLGHKYGEYSITKTLGNVSKKRKQKKGKKR